MALNTDYIYQLIRIFIKNILVRISNHINQMFGDK